VHAVLTAALMVHTVLTMHAVLMMQELLTVHAVLMMHELLTVHAVLIVHAVFMMHTLTRCFVRELCDERRDKSEYDANDRSSDAADDEAGHPHTDLENGMAERNT